VRQIFSMKGESESLPSSKANFMRLFPGFVSQLWLCGLQQ
jgi:hypothetical protein